MRRVKMIVAILFSVWIECAAQQSLEMESILSVLGVTDPEEIDSYEYESLYDLLEHPLKINLASQSELSSSGLFSRYQVASFLDYRSRNGEVLSYMELAAVDGFTEEFVSLVRPFVSLYSIGLPGHPEKYHRSVRNDLAVKGAFKSGIPGEKEWNYGLKYRLKVGNMLSAAAAVSKAYGAEGASPGAFAGSLMLEARKFRGRILVGDYNARFGQGLALWNGSMINSLTSPSAFMKKASGLSQSWSYTGSSALTGVAGDIGLGQFVLSAFVDMPGLKDIKIKQYGGEILPDFNLAVRPGFNVAWQSRFGQLSVTHIMQAERVVPEMKTSADVAYCIRGVNIYGEASYDWVGRQYQILSGTDFRVCEGLRMASLLRFYSDDLYGIAVSGAYDVKAHKGTFSVDTEYYPVPKSKDVDLSLQCKGQFNWEWQIIDCLTFKMRVSERLRTWGVNTRTDIRTDFCYAKDCISATARFNVLRCRGTSFVNYLEGGYKRNNLSVYARQGFFIVDNWDDRIYVYERDAPGSFNVPAMYGRGLWTSLVMAWRFASVGRLYARASYTSYPFMPEEKKKPGKAELKLQFVFRF